MKIKVASNTNIGHRDNNQDAYQYINRSKWSCFIVADGLGGHEMGATISSKFCHEIITLSTQFSANISLEPEKYLCELYYAALKNVQTFFHNNFPNIDAHTTCAIAWLTEEMIATVHVGDSRIYLYDSKNLQWRTYDHSLVQQLFEEGYIKAHQVPHHTLQNQLLKTVNIFNVISPEIHKQKKLETGELLLLCTDGFWTVAKPAWFSLLINSKKLQSDLDHVIYKSIQEAGTTSDNVTLIAIQKK